MLEGMLSSKSKVKIIRILIGSPEREFSLNDVLRETKMSWGTAYPSMKSLVSSRIVTARKAGRTKIYRINKNNLLFRELSGMFKGESEAPLRIAKEFTSKLGKHGIESVILFGSAARGEAKDKSDIDLLFITKGPKPAKKETDALVRDFADRYDIDIVPIYMTQPEFDRRKKKFDRFVMNVIQEGVVLFGKAGD